MWPHRERWVTWEPTDRGEIRASAPRAFGRDYSIKLKEAFETWTDFARAQDWAAKLPGHSLAFIILDRDANFEEDCVLIEYDDVRDPGVVGSPPTVREHLAAAESCAAVSRTETGFTCCVGGQFRLVCSRSAIRCPSMRRSLTPRSKCMRRRGLCPPASSTDFDDPCCDNPTILKAVPRPHIPDKFHNQFYYSYLFSPR